MVQILSMSTKKKIFIFTTFAFFIFQIVFYKPQTSFRVDGGDVFLDFSGLNQKIKNSDFILVYNPGGVGRTTLDQEHDWGTIIDGIKRELHNMDYKVNVIEYMRSDYTIMGIISGWKENLIGFRSSSKELAYKLNFFLEETNKTIIVIGESTGAAYSSKVMDLIKDKERIYSIQAGMPFFFKRKDVNPNTLFLTSNGQRPDPVYEGNIFEIVKNWIINRKESNGHVYNWEHKHVAEGIRNFIKANFGN